ncbi:hypothetical protein ACFU9Y_33860, partial [Streptomyces sp. NPDC057621]|uniref:hypothetical protein n=1 Tax=Streptomyces sp. NPDC057621 TaxID=3346186 RepID=UPI00369FB92A
VLLAGAVVAAAALLAMMPVLVVVVLGPLALAATAADAWRPLTTAPRPGGRAPAAVPSSDLPST